MRARELSIATTLGRVAPAPHPGSSIELTLVGGAGEPAQGCKCGRPGPAICLPCGSLCEGMMPPSILTLSPRARRRARPWS